ncbi:sugar O-acetyltransferase, partial [Lysinibacillus sphaericus CBAM5]
MNKLIIMIGNGGHASVLTEMLLSQKETIIGFTAPTTEENAFGLTYLGSDEVIEQYNPADIELVLAIGTIKPSPLREKIFNKFTQKTYQFKSVIHPSAIIAPSVQLGQGVQIMAG